MCGSESFFLSSIVPVVVFFSLCVLLSPDRASSPLVVVDTTSRALVNGLVAKKRPACHSMSVWSLFLVRPSNDSHPPPTDITISSLTLGPPHTIEPRLSKPIRKK